MQPLMLSTSIERYDPLLTSSESLALTGFLTGYSGLTRVALDRHATYIVAACLAGAAR